MITVESKCHVVELRIIQPFLGMQIHDTLFGNERLTASAARGLAIQLLQAADKADHAKLATQIEQQAQIAELAGKRRAERAPT